MSNAKYYTWSALGKLGSEILSFTGNVLIARVLSPDDYGLVAMLSIFIGISMNLTDAGFNDGLLRKHICSKSDYGTVATYNIIVSVIIYVLLFLLSPYIATFYQHEELESITKVIALSIVLKAFCLSGFVQLTKQLRFKQSSIIANLTSLCSIVIVYVLALCEFGYWALAVQPLVVSLFNIIFLMSIAKWKPYFCFDYTKFKEMWAFSNNLLLSYIVNQIGRNAYSVIIGKFFSPTSLGFYNQAQKMQTVPTNGLNSVVMTTSYPILAKETDLKKREKMYENLISQYTWILAFFAFALICASDAVFVILLGMKWLPSAPLFKLFMLIAITYPLVTINSNIVKLQGKSNVYRNLTFLRNGLQILALIICGRFSLEVILYGQIIATYLSVSIDIYMCGSTVGLTFIKELRLWGREVLLAFSAFLIAKSLFFFVPFISSLSIVPKSVSSTFVYIVVFIFLSEITHNSMYYSIKEIISLTIKKLTK